MFADDAYNKYTKNGHGSLVGNWLEERSIRDATGEGRTVPQRHIKRSGLLKDFTKTPSAGPRKQDNTFERVCGPECKPRHVPFSKTFGAGEEDLTGEGFPVALLLQAQGRVAKTGPRELQAAAARLDVAIQDVQEEEDERDRRANDRIFSTTSGTVFSKPDETKVEKPTHTRQSFMKELRHGRAPCQTRALRNAGLEMQSNVHYSNVNGITHAHMSLVDSELRNDMRVSASTGFSCFGKSAEFSKPVGEFIRGLSKDDAMDEMYASLSGSDPLQRPGGSAPRATAFAGVPSLTVLKSAVHLQVEAACGPSGYVLLRQRLYDSADHEGFVSMSDAAAVFRGELDVSPEEVPDQALQIFLQQYVTMKKAELRVSALMTSLRPPLPQQTKRRVLETFASLGPTGGAIPLGAWLSSVGDDELRQTLITAFGGHDEASVAQVPVTEAVFLELFGDLAALRADVSDLLIA